MVNSSRVPPIKLLTPLGVRPWPRQSYYCMKSAKVGGRVWHRRPNSAMGVGKASPRRPEDEVTGPALGKKIQGITVRDHSNSTPGYLPKGNGDMCPYKNLCTNVHCSVTQNN